MNKHDPKYRLTVGIANTEKALEADPDNGELKEQLAQLKAKLAEVTADGSPN